MATAIYIGNDHVVKLEGLEDQDGNAVTSATVKARILDLNYDDVSGLSWPLTLSHDGGGTYSAVLDKAVSLTRNSRHYLQITAAQGGTEATWRLPLKAQERES